MKRILHLVFQTHWDREWYFTFERYRYRLMHVIERAMSALENHEIEAFVLDGQTLPLEDYLEVCEPIDRTRILKLINEGRMIIGPWFIAMDEFLVHGESIIRNLEIGHQIASRYGQVQKVGYLPDTFGHVGQMPQLLKGFHIDHAFMWRGVSIKDSEFMWRGIDDSKLFTIYLVEGYYQPLLNQPDRADAIQGYVKRIESFARSHHLLLTAGGDHLMPSTEPLDQKMKDVLAANPDFDIRVSSYASYAETLKEELKDQALLQVTGELRDNHRAYILPNVLSTRSYLKQQNQTLEDHMIGYIEPMAALAFMKAEKAPKHYIEHIWKTILQNQPHDSICGCSIDEVHQENEMRALKAQEMIASFQEGIDHQMGHLPMTYYNQNLKKIDQEDRLFSVYNPHPYAYTGIIEGVLWLSQEHNAEQLVIKDEHGHICQTVVKCVEAHRIFQSPLDYPPVFRHGKAYHVIASVKDLKPLAHTRFNVIEHPGEIVSPQIASSIENKLIKVTLHDDGSIDLDDKTTHQTYHHWHQFYSSMDAGDSYNYSKPLEDHYSYAFIDGEPIVESSSLVHVMRYRLMLVQPESLEPSRKKASAFQVTTTLDVELTLYHDESLIRVQTTIDQQAKDQRLRLRFPLGIKLEEHINDSVFELVKRPSNRKEEFETTRLKEVPVVVDSTLSMVYGAQHERGIRFYHRGLHESQMIEDHEQTTLEMTIIRSVSHLSRDDFRSRGGAAGPNLATPDAQCIRKHVFHYAFGPSNSHLDPVNCYTEAQVFRKPPIIRRAYGEGQPSLIKKEQDGVQLSSLRLIKPYTLEVRLWNPYHDERTTTLSSDDIIAHIDEVTLDHRVIVSSDVTLHFKPHEIKTLIIQYKSR